MAQAQGSLTRRARHLVLGSGLAWFLSLSLVLVLSGCTVNSAKNRYILAEKLWTNGNYAASVTEFERVVAKDPRGKLGLQALYRAAMTQSLYLSKHEDAVRKLRTFVEVSGDVNLNWEAQKQIGEILFSKTEQYENSIQHYRILVKQRPDAPELPEFLYRIGKSHFYLWQFDEAIAAFRDLIKRFPTSSQAEKGAYEIGLSHYTRGEHNPGGQGPATESYQEAMDAYQRFIRNYPKSPLVSEAKFGIASCLEELDQLDAAYHQFEALLKTYHSPKVIRIKLTRIRERQAQKSR